MVGHRVSKMSVNGLLINNSNVCYLTQSDMASFGSKEYWHKFNLQNGGNYDKETVLQGVLDAMSPHDLVPVKYTVSGNDSHFLARNCKQAIEKLCLKLMDSFPLGENLKKIDLSIETCHLPIDQFKVNMQFHLKKAIEKRQEKSPTGFIDLSSFHKEPELYEILYCPLSRPKFLLYILNILKRIVPVTSIDLSNNDIEDVNPLEALEEFKGLICLNLSHNKIKNASAIEVIKKALPGLQEINLCNNPVCDLFEKELDYVRWITKAISSIKKIDGVALNFKLPYQQTWFCQNNISGVVNDFLEHYFTLYDNDRKTLENSYDENAIFSMSCSCYPPEKFNESKLKCYQYESRSLLRVNDENKIVGLWHSKNSNIVKIITTLPKTEHDPYSFKVDVINCQETSIILIVSGIFKDSLEMIRSFNRTFSLKKISSDEYKIINDLYHVTNATVDEINNSFLHTKPTENQMSPKRFVNKDEEQKMVETVSNLTEMNSTYSKKCLEDCNWDLKEALEVFVENYKTFNIPTDAFLS